MSISYWTEFVVDKSDVDKSDDETRIISARLATRPRATPGRNAGRGAAPT